MVRDAIDLAQVVGNDWTEGQYYDEAEASMDAQWANLIWPIIHGSDFSNVAEIAAGHGRNTVKLVEISERVIATDINQTNVDFLAERFANHPKVAVRKNTGADLRFIENGSISFVYSFDAMVHFDSDIVRSYIREIRRILKPGGRSFCHYSAFEGNPTGTYRDHPGWRNFMSQALFEHWLAKEGFRVLRSTYVRGVLIPADSPDDADSLTYFELPEDAPPAAPFESIADIAQRLEDGLSRIAELEAKLADAEARLAQLHRSTSWRVTAPLRGLASALKK